MKQKTKGSYFTPWLKRLIAGSVFSPLGVKNPDARMLMNAGVDTPFHTVGLDSLDVFEVGYRLDEELNVGIPDDELTRWINIAESEEYLNTALAKKGETMSVAKYVLFLDIGKALGCPPTPGHPLNFPLRRPLRALEKDPAVRAAAVAKLEEDLELPKGKLGRIYTMGKLVKEVINSMEYGV